MIRRSRPTGAIWPSTHSSRAAATTRCWCATCARTRTTVVSRATGTARGVGNGDSGVSVHAISISADGRRVAFDSEASNLTPATATAGRRVRARPARPHHHAGQPGQRGARSQRRRLLRLCVASPPTDASVAFESDADNLVRGGARGDYALYVRNLRTRTTTLVSRASGPAGAFPNNDTYNDQPWIQSPATGTSSPSRPRQPTSAANDTDGSYDSTFATSRHRRRAWPAGPAARTARRETVARSTRAHRRRAPCPLPIGRVQPYRPTSTAACSDATYDREAPGDTSGSVPPGTDSECGVADDRREAYLVRNAARR